MVHLLEYWIKYVFGTVCLPKFIPLYSCVARCVCMCVCVCVCVCVICFVSTFAYSLFHISPGVVFKSLSKLIEKSSVTQFLNF